MEVVDEEPGDVPLGVGHEEQVREAWNDQGILPIWLVASLA